MGNRDVLARILAIIGTILVALPLLLPLAFSLRSIGRPGGYQVDYLMPFEFYPITLVGVALLVWASLRSHLRRKAVGIAIGIMLGGFVLCAIAAQVTGIANSVEQLEPWRYVLTAGLGGVSLLGQAALIVLGCLLVRDLFAAKSVPSSSIKYPFTCRRLPRVFSGSRLSRVLSGALYRGTLQARQVAHPAM